MKIRAIRLKEVGRFSTPVALEGLTGGLDVLAGPNELGKSTILRAVNTALFLPHTSKKQEIEELRPYSGGAPLIELDLDVQGRPWRLRKQYLTTRSAELHDLSTGQVSRGGDAETLLCKLLGGTGHFSLLCVTQGEALASMAPVKTGGATFMAAIESEVENVADGSAARFVAGRVKAELAGLVTSHNPPRPAGALKAAIDRRDDLVKQRDDARERLRRALDRLEALQDVRVRLAEIGDAEAAQLRQRERENAQRTFEDAQKAREKLKLAEAAVEGGQKQLAAAQALLEALERRIDALAQREAAAAKTAPLLAACEARGVASVQKTKDARQNRDALKGVLAGLERDRQALARRDRLAELSLRLEAARAAEAERMQLVQALKGNAADERTIEAARREASSILKLEARLSASAPRVSLAYVDGGAGRVTLDGRALGDGEVLQPTRPIRLEIAGVGVLTIEPGQSDDVARDEDALAAHRARREELLLGVGARSLEEAERLLAERRDGEARLAEVCERLKMVAREGIQSLQQSHAELAATVAASNVAGSTDDIDARASETQGALAEAEAMLAEAEAAEGQAREEWLTLRAQANNYAADIASLSEELGAPEARAAALAERRAALGAARETLNVAVLEAAAWRDKSPDEARVSALQKAAEAARIADEKARAEISALRETEIGLLGELKSDRAEDVEARVEELEALCGQAEARCADLQQEAQALLLLMKELDAAATRTRDRFARPVVGRLAPYLQLMWPEAHLVLGEDLAPQALERRGVREEFARLSGGTQEQLGLLVRLAFAQLLADTGTPAPLIIDDAVVNTDDDRLKRLFQALQLAAKSHQVLVLSCRERDFDELGGRRIALAQWNAERVAA